MKKHSLLLLAAMFVSTNIYSGDIATERTQAASSLILGGIQWATDALKTATQAIETWETRAADLINQATAGFQMLTADNVLALATELQPIIEAGEALAHTAADLEVTMNQKFKTYDDYLQVIGDEITAHGELHKPDFERRFREWNDTHRDTIKNTLKAHGLHAEKLMDKHTRVEELKRLSTSATGRMQALQAGHQIAVEEVKQLNELQQILMEQSNLHASYFSMKQAMDAETEAVSKIRREKAMPTSTIDGTGFLQ